MDTQQIALQLYTVRDHTQRDMLGTLHAVAQIGYRAVEFAGYGGVPGYPHGQPVVYAQQP